MCKSLVGLSSSKLPGMARDTLTVERIVRAAIELLDAEGLDGLNLRALGKRLGSAATAVYWHVESKDNLVRLAADAVWSEIELPDLDQNDWRSAVTAMAGSQHAVLERHAWLAQAFGSYLIYGPGKARHDDHGLALFERAGLTSAEAEQAMTTVFIFVLGGSLGRASEVSLARKLSLDGGDPEKQIADAMAKAAEIAMAYPRLAARLQETPMSSYAATSDEQFRFSLEAILDGLEARLAPLRGAH